MKKILFLLTLVLLCSCSTPRYLPTESVNVHDTLYVNKVQMDSIYIDRFREIFTKGDTVYRTEYKTEYKFRYIHDTVDRRVMVVDTLKVPVEIPVIKQVNHIPWWSKILNYLGGFALLAIVLLIIKKFAL